MASRFSVARLADASAATGTAKSMLRLLTGANDPITIISWWMEFDSVASTDKPIKIEVKNETATSAPTGTSVTPLALGPGMGTAAVTALAVNTAEGTPTYSASDWEDHFVPATSGIYVQYPLGREIIVTAGNAIRWRVTAVTNTVNITYGCEWEE